MQKKDLSYLFYLLRRSFSVGGFFTISLVGCFLVLPQITKAGVVYKPPLSLGLVSFWSFENNSGGTSVTDYSGNGHTGTLTNMDASSDYVSGHNTISTALDLDGSDDYVNIASNTDFETTQFSIVAWVKLDNTSKAGQNIFGLVDQTGPDATRAGYQLVYNYSSNNRFFARVFTGGTLQKNVESSVINDTDWHHVVMTWSDGSTYPAMYIDGQLDNAVTYSDSGGDTTISYPPSYDPRIGKAADPNDSSDSYWDGKIDDVRFYDRVLSATEVLTLYQFDGGKATFKQPSNTNLVGYWSFEDATGTKATDFSGNGNTGTLTNMDANTDWVSGRVGKALDFDGTDDYVALSAINITSYTGLTISSWVKTTSADSTSSDSGSPALNIVSDTSGEWENTFGVHGGKVRYCKWDDSWLCYDGTSFVNDGNWHFVTVTHVSSTGAIAIYVDGRLETTGTRDYSSVAPPFYLSAIGAAYNGQDTFNGQLDEVRIYNTALTATQIQNLYQNSKKTTLQAPQNDKITDGLVGYWTFNGKDLTTTTATDVSGNGNNGTLTNGPVPAQGKVGQGLDFDGVDDYIALSASAPPTDVTLNAWINFDSISGEQQIHSWFTSALNKDFTFQTNGARLEMEFYTNGSNYRVTRSTGSLTAGAWHMVTMTQSGSGHANFFLDGVALSNDVETTVGTPSKELLIRAIGRFGDQAAELLDGTIDELRIYDRVLSIAEIVRLYNLGR